THTVLIPIVRSPGVIATSSVARVCKCDEAPVPRLRKPEPRRSVKPFGRGYIAPAHPVWQTHLTDTTSGGRRCRDQRVREAIALPSRGCARPAIRPAHGTRSARLPAGRGRSAVSP